MLLQQEMLSNEFSNTSIANIKLQNKADGTYRDMNRMNYACLEHFGCIDYTDNTIN